MKIRARSLKSESFRERFLENKWLLDMLRMESCGKCEEKLEKYINFSDLRKNSE